MLDLVAAEDEAILLGEGLHLRVDEGVSAGAPQPCHVAAVDDALAGGASPEDQGRTEEALHSEALKGAVELYMSARNLDYQVSSLTIISLKCQGNAKRRLSHFPRACPGWDR